MVSLRLSSVHCSSSNCDDINTPGENTSERPIHNLIHLHDDGASDLVISLTKVELGAEMLGNLKIFYFATLQKTEEDQN